MPPVRLVRANQVRGMEERPLLGPKERFAIPLSAHLQLGILPGPANPPNGFVGGPGGLPIGPGPTQLDAQPAWASLVDLPVAARDIPVATAVPVAPEVVLRGQLYQRAGGGLRPPGSGATHGRPFCATCESDIRDSLALPTRPIRPWDGLRRPWPQHSPDSAGTGEE